MLLYIKEVRNKLREINDCEETVTTNVSNSDDSSQFTVEQCCLSAPCEKCQLRMYSLLMWAAEDWED